jgi:hypothetical protein
LINSAIEADVTLAFSPSSHSIGKASSATFASHQWSATTAAFVLAAAERQ